MASEVRRYRVRWRPARLRRPHGQAVFTVVLSAEVVLFGTGKNWYGDLLENLISKFSSMVA
jgi:hypothetical protein